jgi:hypothetical protein
MDREFFLSQGIAAGPLPRFHEAFPSLLDPTHRQYIDQFDGAVSGSLIGGRLVSGGATWQTCGNIPSGTAPWKVHDKGFAYLSTLATGVEAQAIFVPAPSYKDGEASFVVQNADGDGEVALVWRNASTVSASAPRFMGILNFDTGTASLVKRTMTNSTTGQWGGSVSLWSAPFRTEAGQNHSMRARFNGAQHDLFIDNEHVFSGQDSTGQTQHAVGIWGRNGPFIVHEVMLGSLS